MIMMIKEMFKPTVVVVLLLFLYVKTNGANVSSKAVERFVGDDELRIGFGENCYLFWKGQSGDFKNAEFRCGSEKGDPMKIVKSGDGYRIGSNSNLWLYWNGNSGNTKNAQFRRGHGSGDKFWIRPQNNGLYAIGFGNCPLFWRGDDGNTKNAEFRCGKSVSDTFWIKGGECKLQKVVALPFQDRAKFDGIEIIGVTTQTSCYSAEVSRLSLSKSIQLTEKYGLDVGRQESVNWKLSVSVAVETGVSIFGLAEASVTMEASASVGGAVSFSSTKSTSSSDTTGSQYGLTVNYNTPGAAMIVGFLKRYKFDKSHLAAKAHVLCKGGYAYTYDTSIRLRSQTYGQAFFKSYTGKLPKDKCTAYSECFRHLRLKTFESVKNAQEQFNNCLTTGKLDG